MPRSLDLGRLAAFSADEVSPHDLRPPEQPVPWPSREPMIDTQISIKAPGEVVERFRSLCKGDRRTYADMLRILMDAFEGRGR